MKDRIRREAPALDTLKEGSGDVRQTPEVASSVPEAPSRQDDVASGQAQGSETVTPTDSTETDQGTVPTAESLTSGDPSARVKDAGNSKMLGIEDMKGVEGALGRLYEDREL